MSDIFDLHNVTTDMYETLALVFVVGMMDHELGHEIAHEGIALSLIHI